MYVFWEWRVSLSVFKTIAKVYEGLYQIMKDKKYECRSLGLPEPSSYYHSSSGTGFKGQW